MQKHNHNPPAEYASTEPYITASRSLPEITLAGGRPFWGGAILPGVMIVMLFRMATRIARTRKMEQRDSVIQRSGGSNFVTDRPIRPSWGDNST